MVNDTGILVVSRTVGNAIRVAPLCDDEFGGKTSYDLQITCLGVAVDGRRLDSMPIYHHHIHWLCSQAITT